MIVQNIVETIDKRKKTTNLTTADTLNMYIEVENNVNVLKSVEGYELVAQMNGKARGVYTVSRGLYDKPTTYCVFDSVCYAVTDEDNVFAINQLGTSEGEVRFCETGGYGSAHPHLIIVDGLNVYAVNTGLSLQEQAVQWKTIPLPKSIKTGVQIRPTHCAYLYGYLVVNDKNTDAFYTSYQYPFEGDENGDDLFMVYTDEYKNVGRVTYSEWLSDNTIGLISSGTKLYTFGTRSYQVFSYNNDIYNPFISPDTGAGLIGCKDSRSIANLGTYTLWYGSADLGFGGVYMIQDGQTVPERVSTNAIEELLKDAKGVVYSTMYSRDRHTFYLLTIGDVTVCYDISNNTWTRRSSYNNKNQNSALRYKHSAFNGNTNYWVCDGALVRMSDKVYTEHDGKPIIRERTGEILEQDGAYLIVNDIELKMNTGNIAGKILMSYSVDGGVFNDTEAVDIGEVGEYSYPAKFYNFGYGKRFVVRLTYSENYPICIYGIIVNADSVL